MAGGGADDEVAGGDGEEAGGGAELAGRAGATRWPAAGTVRRPAAAELARWDVAGARWACWARVVSESLVEVGEVYIAVADLVPESMLSGNRKHSSPRAGTRETTISKNKKKIQ
jgi:hypothetical protein